MIRFLVDENFNNHIIRGVKLRNSKIDILRVQDVGLSGEDDPIVLEFAMKENLILLTHDVETIPRFAYERIIAGKEMPAIFIIKQDILISQVIENILLIFECCNEDELKNNILKIEFISQQPNITTLCLRFNNNFEIPSKFINSFGTVIKGSNCG